MERATTSRKDALLDGFRRQVSKEMCSMAYGASPSLIALGISSGSTLSCYLASVGYFNAKLQTDTLVGLQALVVYSVQIAVLIVGLLLDEWVDRKVGIVHSYGFRIIGMALVSSLVSLAVPFCESVVSVLVTGAVLAAANAAQFSSTIQLAATGAKGAGVISSLGVTVGSVVPLATTHLTGFRPGCTVTRAVCFYVVSCIIGVLGVLLWTLEHCWALRNAGRRGSAAEGHGEETGISSSSENAEDPFVDEALEQRQLLTPTGRFMRAAYSSLSRSSLRKKNGAMLMSSLSRFCNLHSVCIFVNFVVGFMLVPLFAKASPAAVQALYLSKCLGDLVSRASATLHSLFCSSRGYVNLLERSFCHILLLVRTMLAILLMIDLVHNRIQSVTVLPIVTVVLIYALGGYAYQMLDLDLQLQGTADELWRKQVQRCHLIVMMSGQIVGVCVGLIWIGAMPTYQELSKGLITFQLNSHLWGSAHV